MLFTLEIVDSLVLFFDDLRYIYGHDDATPMTLSNTILKEMMLFS